MIVPSGEDPSVASRLISEIPERIKKLDLKMGRPKLESIFNEFKLHVWDMDDYFLISIKLKTEWKRTGKILINWMKTEEYPLETVAEHLARVMFSEDEDIFIVSVDGRQTAMGRGMAAKVLVEEITDNDESE